MIYMYADGACSGNGTESARAGWAFTVYADEGESTSDLPEHEYRTIRISSSSRMPTDAAAMQASSFSTILTPVST